LSPREAAASLASATTEIFAVRWCRIVDGDGLLLGTCGEPPPEGSDADAPLGRGTDGRQIEIGLAGGRSWTDGDQASLEVMALLVGTVLDESETYGRAVGRADRLDRLNRLQREFLRSVSHNLRTPLATIELAATDLEEADDTFVRTRAEAILVEERRLARIVSQVLVLSRIETGTLHFDEDPVALAPVARRVARELGIADHVEVIDHAGGAVAMSDPGATEQIAWILLDNANRYAPGSPIRVTVERSGSHAGDGIAGSSLVLAVEDEGPGVPQEERRRIFARFVRGSAGSRHGGTGLGLSVARGLARSLGGDVTYRPGAIGARFEIRLPSAGEDWPGEAPLGETADSPEQA
ncbi:MAG: HAMP domain-containing sensor histidine kinase, partial [Chloroflexota bacterium]